MIHRRSGTRYPARLFAAAMMCALLVALAACADSASDVADPTTAPTTTAPSSPPPPGGPTRSSAEATTPTAPPTPDMTSAQARADAGEIHDNGCYAHHDDTAAPDPEDCTYGFFDGDTVILYGDAHAAQWFEAANEVATRHDWRLLPVTKEGCPPGDQRVHDQRQDREYTECTEWHANAMRMIEEQEPVLVLVAARSDHYRIAEDGGTLSVADSAGRLGQALAQDLRAFAAMGARTVLIRDIQVPGFDVPDCIEVHAPDSCTYRMREDLPDDTEQRAAATSTGTPVVDLRAEVCGDPTECRAMIDGLITFRDAENLAVTFAGTLADQLDAGIEALPA